VSGVTVVQPGTTVVVVPTVVGPTNTRPTTRPDVSNTAPVASTVPETTSAAPLTAPPAIPAAPPTTPPTIFAAVPRVSLTRAPSKPSAIAGVLKTPALRVINVIAKPIVAARFIRNFLQTCANIATTYISRIAPRSIS